MVRVNIYKRRLKTGKLGDEGALPDRDVQSRGDGRYLALMWATARCSGGMEGVKQEVREHRQLFSGLWTL